MSTRSQIHRAQLALEAMIVIAAFIAFLALLISAASENAGQTASAGGAIAHEKAAAYRLLASSVVEDDGVVFSGEVELENEGTGVE